MTDASKATGPLAGVRILDMTAVGMGPWATQILGDMGADVIKVESPDGDIFRHVTPQRHAGMSHAFLNLNRNKRSIVLDAREPEDRASLLALVALADVFISNLRPASLKRLGLDFATLAAEHPRLIYCGCYGYSESGPYAGRAAVDDTIQAASGMAHFQGGESGTPAYVRSVAADKIAALWVSQAIGFALYAREKSGRGQAIEVPMFESVTAFMMVEHLAGRAFDPAVGPAGYARVATSARKPFRTRDGHLALVPYTDAQWRRFFALIGTPEVLADPRFADVTARSQHIPELYAMIEATLVTRSTAEWVAVFAAADIPFAPVNDVDALLADPHLQATGFWQRDTHPTEGGIVTPGIPLHFSATPGNVRRLAPNLGEHTAEVLAEIGRPHAPREKS
ncbi:MAG: CoA transferase [Burkholderiales bacterium]|nr:CoA transferase [Burkholderiales bacterium]